MSLKHLHYALTLAWAFSGTVSLYAQAPDLHGLPKDLDAVGLAGDYSATMDIETGGKSVSGRIVRKGSNSRVTMRMPGQANPMTVLILPDKQFADGSKGISYVLLPENKTYIRLPLQQAGKKGAPASENLKSPNGSNRGQEASVVGSEVIDGEPCIKKRIALPDADPGTTCFIWCSPKNQNKTVKIEQKTPQSSSVIRMKNYDFTPPNDALFRIPDGYKLVNTLSAPPASSAKNQPPPSREELQQIRSAFSSRNPNRSAPLPPLPMTDNTPSTR